MFNHSTVLIFVLVTSPTCDVCIHAIVHLQICFTPDARKMKEYEKQRRKHEVRTYVRLREKMCVGVPPEINPHFACMIINYFFYCFVSV